MVGSEGIEPSPVGLLHMDVRMPRAQDAQERQKPSAVTNGNGPSMPLSYGPEEIRAESRMREESEHPPGGRF